MIATASIKRIIHGMLLISNATAIYIAVTKLIHPEKANAPEEA